MKRLGRALRLFWFALRNPRHEDAVVAWRLGKSRVLPYLTYLFNLESPTTTLTTHWLGRTIHNTTVTNPFYWPDYPEGQPPNLGDKA